jgi:hypothetical protein
MTMKHKRVNNTLRMITPELGDGGLRLCVFSLSASILAFTQSVSQVSGELAI